MFTSKGFNMFVAVFFLLTGLLNLVGAIIELSVYQLFVGVVCTTLGVYWYKHNVK
ncbi:MAG: hypothetical protein IIV99_05895 [Oscillospiraceae bacterium]|nr:hypothetical protein [Oscillospiraceae bacterium]